MHSALLKQTCELDPACIDDIDYMEGDEALALIWCDTHATYHWKWVPKTWVGRSL